MNLKKPICFIFFLILLVSFSSAFYIYNDEYVIEGTVEDIYRIPIDLGGGVWTMGSKKIIRPPIKLSNDDYTITINYLIQGFCIESDCIDDGSAVYVSRILTPLTNVLPTEGDGDETACKYFVDLEGDIWEEDAFPNRCCGDDFLGGDFKDKTKWEINPPFKIDSNSKAHTGSNSLYVKDINLGGMNTAATSKNSVFIQEGKEYLLTGWIWDDLVRFDTFFQLLTTELEYCYARSTQGFGGWERVSCKLEPDKSGKAVVKAMVANPTEGDIWFDDVRIIGAEDFGYVDSKNRYFCNKDLGADQTIEPDLSKAQWNWWNAQEDVFKIHSVAGLYDIVSNGEFWYYCNADDSIDEFGLGGIPIINLGYVPESEEEIEALCPCKQGKYFESKTCLEKWPKGPPPEGYSLCWKDFATWCDDTFHPPQTLADCGVWVNEQGIDTNPITDDQITTVDISSTLIDTSEAFNNKLGDFGEIITYDPSKKCEEDNKGVLCNYKEDKRCVNGRAVNTNDTKNNKDLYCCIGPEASCMSQLEGECEKDFKFVLCDIGEKCVGEELNTPDSSEDQPCCESYQYCKSDIEDLSGDIVQGLNSYERGKANICYNEDGRNYIGECCSGSFCSNKERQDFTKNSYDFNTFGIGGMLYSIMSYDSVENGFFKTKVRRFYSSSASADGTYINIIPIISTSFHKYGKSDWSEFDYLNFKLASNYHNYNNNIIIYDIDGKTLFNKTLDQYTNNIQPGIWHAYKIPLDDADDNKLRNNKIHSVYIRYEHGDEFYIFMDNFYLSKEKEETRYCSGPFGKWLTDVEDETITDYSSENFINWAPYKYVCDYQLAYAWTGTKCCGDDYQDTIGEYYDNEKKGGCFSGVTIFNNERVSDYGFVNKDLLFAEEKFQQCGRDPGTFYGSYPDNYFIARQNTACTIYGNYFCNFSDEWIEKDKIQGLTNQEDITSLANKQTPTGSSLGCCPDNMCWDGTQCVEAGTLFDNNQYLCNEQKGVSDWEICNQDNYCEILLEASCEGEDYCYCSTDDAWHGTDDDTPLTNQETPTGSSQSCCPENKCWDGENCVKPGALFGSNYVCYKPEFGTTSYWKLCNENHHCELLLGVECEGGLSHCYCGIDNEWSGTEDTTLEKKPNPPDITTPPSVGCCSADKCWNSQSQEGCVISSLGISLGETAPSSNNGFLEEATSYSHYFGFPGVIGQEFDQYVCEEIDISGEWSGVYKKTSPDDSEDYGYCLHDNQCWNGTQCIGSGYFWLENDNFCDNGNWSSRTKLVALTLFKKVEDAISFEDYTLFCDDYSKSLNNQFSFILSEWDNIGDEANNFCVLEFMQGNKKVTAFGVALKKNIENTKLNEIVDIDTTKCSSTTYRNIYGEYDECDTDELWYNNQIKTVIYSLRGIEDIEKPTIFEFFVNPLKVIVNEVIHLMFVLKIYGGIEDTPDYGFAEGIKNFNRIYISTKVGKTIRGVVEKVYDEEFMVVKYINFFGEPICAAVQKFKENNQENNFQVECNIENEETYISSKDQSAIDIIWNDLTSKLRIRYDPLCLEYSKCMPPRFIFEDTAYFDSFGNLVLKGFLVQGITPQSTDNEEFILQNPNGDDVAIIDLTNGIVYIKGKLYEHSSILTPGENDFIIRDNEDQVVAYIDEFGNLYLKGKLTEDVPYLRW